MRALLVVILLLFCVNAHAIQGKKIKYKPEISDDYKKIEFLYIAQEELRKEHNRRGDDFRNGVITQEEWDAWQADYFRACQDAIATEIIRIKNSFKNSINYSVDLENDFENN